MASPNYIFLGVLVLVFLGAGSAHRVLLSTDNDKSNGPSQSFSHTQPRSKLGSGGSYGRSGSFCDSGSGGGCGSCGGPSACGAASSGGACPSFPGTGGGFLCGSVPLTPHCGSCPPAVGSPTCGGCPPAGWGASGCPISSWGSGGSCFQMNSFPGMAAGSTNGAHNEPLGSQTNRTGQAVAGGDGEPALPNDDGAAVPAHEKQDGKHH